MKTVSRNLVSIIFTLLLCAFLPLSGCRESDTPPPPPPSVAQIPAGQQDAPVPQKDQPLNLLRFGPSGEVNQLSQVVAMFDQPMVALGAYQKVSQEALTLEPTQDGKLLWLNQYTLAFVFKTPLTGSATLKAKLHPALLPSLTWAKLDKEAEIEISLPQLGIRQARQLDYPAYDEDRALTPVWQVVFTQEPDLESLATKVNYKYMDQNREVVVPAIVIPTQKTGDGPNPQEFSFDLTAREKLPLDRKYSLVLEAGVKSLAGPQPGPHLVMAEGATFGPLTVTLEDSGQDKAFPPDQYMQIYFSNPVKISELLPHLRLNNGYDLAALEAQFSVDPDTVLQPGFENMDNIQTYLTLPGNFKARTSYTLTVSGDAKDIYGQSLGRQVTLSFTTGEYETFLHLPDQYSLLETSSPALLPLVASNISEARLQGFALTTEEAIKLMALTGSPNYYDSSPALEKLLADLTPIITNIEVPDEARNGAVTIPVDLREIFQGQLDRFLYLRAEWPDPQKGDEAHMAQTGALTQISDIGLALKTGLSSSLIWTTNLALGRPWAGVELEVRDRNGQILWSGLSDEEGLATFPGTAELLKKIEGDQTQLFVVARAEGQMSLWNTDWNDGLEPWRWNIEMGSLRGQLATGDNWLLNALPLYKPGETAKFTIIARTQDGDHLRDLMTEEMVVEVRDSNHQVVDRSKLSPGPFGTISHELKLPEDAPLGYWGVSLGGVEDKYLTNVGTFQVLTYRAPAFKIQIENLPTEAIVEERVDLSALASYHFGGPVSSQPAKYSVTATPTFFSLPGNFSDYNVINTFGPVQDSEDTGRGYHEPTVTITKDSTRLTPQGGLKIPIDLTSRADQKPRPRSYETYVTVTDVDQREVSTNASFLVHPAQLYVGLGGDNYIAEVGEPHLMKVIVADHLGYLHPGREVKITLFERQWQNVRRKGPGGAWDYVSRQVDHPVSHSLVISEEMPVELELVPKKAGYHWVLAEITDAEGRPNQAGRDFYVSGPGPVGWQMDNDDSLTLVTDQTEYKPGQTARIMVQSPFEEGTGLLTVERAGVRHSQVFKIENQSPVLEVPLTLDEAPNVFVSVLLTRGRIAEEVNEKGLDFGKPTLRLGYTELKITGNTNLLTATVTPERTEVGPGDEVEVTIKVTDSEGQPFNQAQVVVIAADAAVLQLVDDLNYYPNRHFQRNRPLSVLTADNLTSLVGRHIPGLKSGHPGGGGAPENMALRADSGADDVRRLFASLAFFDPEVALDDQGQGRVKIKMPENLTTFKIFAVVIGHGRVGGTGVGSIMVTRDLVARSALPNYAGVGDEFQAAMVVTNRGEESGQATVELTGQNFILKGKNKKKVEIASGESLEVRFPVQAGSDPEAKFLFTVKLGKEQDRVEYSIPVSPANQLTTEASYERLTPGTREVSLTLPPEADPTRGGLTVEISPSLVGVLQSAFDWMRAYPYGCVEQVTSKAYAKLVWLSLADRLGADEKQKEAARQEIKEALSKLSQWDTGGGYNFWPESHDWSNRSVYLSAYILDFLLSARDQGFDLPDPGLIKRLSEFLTPALSDTPGTWPQWYSETAVADSQSYALAMLSRAGEKVEAYVEYIYDNREEATLFELINLLRAINFLPPREVKWQQDASNEQAKVVLEEILNHIEVTAGEIQIIDPGEIPLEIWASPVRTTAMTLLALCETEAGQNLIPKERDTLIPALVRWLASSTRAGHFGTTQNNALALEAIGEYVRVMEPGQPDIKVVARLAQKDLVTAEFKSYTAPPVTGLAPVSDIPATGAAVTYDTTGQGQAWASLKLQTASLKPDLRARGSGGFVLSRSYAVIRPEKGLPGASSFQPGDVVLVTVTMMVPAQRLNVVLEDRVPAGLEPINFNLADADQTLLGLDQSDLRPGTQSWPHPLWYNHQEIWPDRVAVYADRLAPGVYTYSYMARAITLGVYLTAGPRAEEMYAPETFGQGEGQVLTVSDDDF